MVPCLHLSNVYIKRKLQVWRVQKCIPLVGANTVPTCSGLQLRHVKQASIRPRTEIWGNPGLPFAMVPFFHQSNVYIKRKLQVWRALKCIPLVAANTALTCTFRQTTPSHVSQYGAENGNLRKFGSTFHHDIVFALKQYLYQKETARM